MPRRCCNPSCENQGWSFRVPINQFVEHWFSYKLCLAYPVVLIQTVKYRLADTLNKRNDVTPRANKHWHMIGGIHWSVRYGVYYHDHIKFEGSRYTRDFSLLRLSRDSRCNSLDCKIHIDCMHNIAAQIVSIIMTKKVIKIWHGLYLWTDTADGKRYRSSTNPRMWTSLSNCGIDNYMMSTTIFQLIW